MLYYLFEFLENNYNLPGTGVFYYISFRSALAIITSLLVSLVFGGSTTDGACLVGRCRWGNGKMSLGR